MVGTAVYCETEGEVIQVINLYHSKGIVYWPDTTFDSYENYLKEFVEYPYIRCTTYGEQLELHGNRLKGLEHYQTFREFMYEHGLSKRQKLQRALRQTKGLL